MLAEFTRHDERIKRTFGLLVGRNEGRQLKMLTDSTGARSGICTSRDQRAQALDALNIDCRSQLKVQRHVDWGTKAD